MRVSHRSVELLLGTPGRGFHAHIHSSNHTHTSVSSSRVHHQFHHAANHRRQYSVSHPNGLLQAGVSWTDASWKTNVDSHHKGFRRCVHQHTSPGNVSSHADYYRTELDSLLVALRQGDTLKLYLCLLNLTRGASYDNEPFCRAVQTIPPTTFSEILRNFDPFHISSHVDSAPGISISWGAAIHSSLGELINKWGVKILYVRILNRLRLLQRARQRPHPDGSPTQIRPLLRDYLILLRCAGATSDIRAAKDIWLDVVDDGYGDWKHAELFAEFIKARYLTEALYANNDLARFRLRPLDMHRSAVLLSKHAVRDLKRLQMSLADKHTHRFGQNVNERYFAEPLTRLLRKRKPLRKVVRLLISRHMIPGDELLLCAILKAYGRHGASYASNVLMRFWGINISVWKRELGNREISGGHDFPSGSAQAPTEALLDAVVHCYGNMGEVRLAKALVDFISRRWSIAVPDKVWSDLLDFARIHSTDPADREWRLSRLTDRLNRIDGIFDIWSFCTKEPYNFQPGIKDYYSLLKSMIGPKRPMEKFLDAFRQFTPLYHHTAQQLRDAWAELILTTQQGVPNHVAYRRYRVLQSSKQYIWHCLHYTARQAFKKMSPMHVDSPEAVRLAPHIVAEFRPFLGPFIQYRIATGIVDLTLDYEPLRTVEIEQTLEKPETLNHRRTFKKWSTGRTGGDEPEGIDEAALRDIPDEPASSTTLRDHVSVMSIKQGDATQLMKDEHLVEEEGEEDVGQDHMDVNQQRAVAGDPRPKRPFQGILNESRNPPFESLAAEELKTASKNESVLSRTPSEDALAFHHRGSLDTSPAPQHIDEWDEDSTTKTVNLTKRWSMAQQLVERPANMWRLRYSAPPGEHSLSALREDGKEFTGFHEDPLKAHYAAHRIITKMTHTPGVPVNLGRPGMPHKGQLVEHLLWLRT